MAVARSASIASLSEASLCGARRISSRVVAPSAATRVRTSLIKSVTSAFRIRRSSFIDAEFRTGTWELADHQIIEAAKERNVLANLIERKDA